MGKEYKKMLILTGKVIFEHDNPIKTPSMK